MTGPQRLHGMDFLSGSMMLLGIVLHDAKIYMPMSLRLRLSGNISAIDAGGIMILSAFGLLAGRYSPFPCLAGISRRN